MNKEELQKESIRLEEQYEWEKYQGEDRVVSLTEIQKEISEEPYVNFTANTRLLGLDKIIEGFRAGNLIVISAQTKNGKTTLAQTFTVGFSKDNIRSLWFSFEVPYREFLEAFDPNNLPITFLPRKIPRTTVRRLLWVESRILESIAKYDCKVVFIDHLHFILDMEEISRGQTSILVGGIMRELKRIAIENDIIIFLIAHMKKTIDSDVPSTEDIRDSSFIAQESDIVLTLWRIKDKKTREYKDESYLAVREHRRTGKVGTIKLLHRDKQFYEIYNQEIVN